MADFICIVICVVVFGGAGVLLGSLAGGALACGIAGAACGLAIGIGGARTGWEA